MLFLNMVCPTVAFALSFVAPLSSALSDPSEGDDVWKRAEMNIDVYFGAPFVVVLEVRHFRRSFCRRHRFENKYLQWLERVRVDSFSRSL
jgi:hypothetical protein